MKRYAIKYERILTGMQVIEAKNIHEAFETFENEWENLDVEQSSDSYWKPVCIEGEDDKKCWLDGPEPQFEKE